MMRSLFFALLVIVLAVDQTQGLASTARTVRGSIWGKLTRQSAPGFPQAAIIEATTPMVVQPLSPAAPDAVGGFDADAYRREMTDLVYQRSMQRGFSS
jgi:hypothetical protein